MTSRQRDRLFVVVGAQRTGTNLLREILNTNPEIAMLGEVFSRSTAPAHWANFLTTLPVAERMPATAKRAQILLDRYFEFVDYRIRNHWSEGDKSNVQAIGLDIKYNQLRNVDPPGGWNDSPYLVNYLKAKDAVLIHLVRDNLVHSAISAMIAEQRGVWHDYEGIPIDRKYTVAPDECLARARQISNDRRAFLEFSKGAHVVDCNYEELVDQLAVTPAGGNIASRGPLLGIAESLCVSSQFRSDVRLHKAINLPYSQLIANHDELVAQLSNSDFAQFARTLG